MTDRILLMTAPENGAAVAGQADFPFLLPLGDGPVTKKIDTVSRH
jgi:hypothetical protein